MDEELENSAWAREPALEEPLLQREPNLYVPPTIPEHMNQAWATAVSTAMQDPASEERIKSQFSLKGRSEEWENYKRMWLRAADERMAQVVLDRAFEKAKEYGYEKPDRRTYEEVVRAGAAELLQQQTNPDIAATIVGAASWDSPGDSPQDAAIRQGFKESMADIIARENIVNDEINQRILDETKEIIKSRGGLEGGWEVAAQLGVSILPGTDQYFWRKVAQSIGLTPGVIETMNVGDLKVHLREVIATASPDERIKMFEDYKKNVINNPLFITDWQKLYATEFLFDSAQVWGAGNIYNSDQQLLDNVFSWVDLGATTTGMARILGTGAFRAAGNPVLRTINNANKQTYVDKVSSILVEPEVTAQEKWNVSKIQIAGQSIPKPSGFVSAIDDVPDEIFDEAERIMQNRLDIAEVQTRTRAAIYSEAERSAAIEREAQRIVDATGGRVRLGLSQIIPHADDAGVTFDVTIGRNNKYGFLGEHNALRLAEKLEDSGLKDVTIWSSDGSKLTQLYSDSRDWRKALAIFNEGGAKPSLGNFYVRYREDYYFNPTDKLIFGETPVASFKGFTVLKELLDPRSLFDENAVYKRYITNLFGEQAINQKLQSIALPVLKLPRPMRRRVGNYYANIETFGKENGRWPTKNELLSMHPEMTAEEYNALYVTKNFYDTVHWIQNDRLFRDYASNGFITLASNVTGGVRYHGKPLTVEEAYRNKIVFDPVIGKPVELTTKRIRELYEAGGKIIDTVRPSAGDGKSKYSLFLYDPKFKKDYELRPLSNVVLDYIPGYYPRMYKDRYFIYKIDPRAQVNGKETGGKLVDVDGNPIQYNGFMEIAAVAPTRREAERFVELRRAEGDGYNWGVLQDSRLSDRDKIAADMDLMQTEGRLFFDERNAERLPSSRGGRADIVDPINLLERTSRMVARQIGSEELTRAMRVAFNKQYADLGIGDITFQRYSTVEAKLAAIGSDRANQALELWRYIRTMEGVGNTASQMFKRLNIVSAEILDRQLSKTKQGRTASQWISDKGVEWTPDRAVKSLAHLYFIKMRPFRQLLLQSMQHLILSGLDPAYVGRWQKDTIGLMLGVSSRSKALSGLKDMANANSAITRKYMGLDEADYNKLITEYDLSGHRGIVDIHSFAGDVPLRGMSTPENRMGDVGQSMSNVAQYIPRAMQKVGFDTGEQFTRAASFMLSVRRYMKNNGIKKISDITDRKAWEEINLRADDFAFSMHRGNQFKYQNGWLSMSLQFLSFTHKSLLTLIRSGIGLPEKAGGKAIAKYGTKTFSRPEAARMLATQLVLYGAAGYGMKELVDTALSAFKLDEYKNTPVANAIETGFIDHAFDWALGQAAGDHSVDMAWDEALAPASSIYNSTVKRFFEVGAELSLSDGLLFTAAGGRAGSELFKALDVAKTIFQTDPAIITPDQKAVWMMDALAAGVGAGFSDMTKWRMAQKLNGYITKSGVPKAYEPKFAEMVVQGVFGVQNQTDLNTLKFFKDTKEYWDALASDANVWYDQVHYIANGYMPDGWDSDKARKFKLNQLTILLDAYEDDPMAREFLISKFVEKMYNQDDRLPDVGDLVSRAITSGKPPLEHMMDEIRKIEKDPAKLEEIERMINGAVADFQQGGAKAEEYIMNEYQGIE